MARFKSSTPVHCRFCGNGIRKWSTTVYVRAERSNCDVQASYCRYVYTGSDKLKTKADCQRHSNQQVISVKYVRPTHDGDPVKGAEYIGSFNEWDGESWYDQYFCGPKCAEAMAYAILKASPNWSTEAYRKACNIS